MSICGSNVVTLELQNKRGADLWARGVAIPGPAPLMTATIPVVFTLRFDVAALHISAECREIKG
jgi:hypothetical protein